MRCLSTLFATLRARLGRSRGARRATLVSTGNAGPSLQGRVSAVLGSKVAALLVPIEVDLPDLGFRVTG